MITLSARPCSQHLAVTVTTAAVTDGNTVTTAAVTDGNNNFADGHLYQPLYRIKFKKTFK